MPAVQVWYCSCTKTNPAARKRCPGCGRTRPEDAKLFDVDVAEDVAERLPARGFRFLRLLASFYFFGGILCLIGAAIVFVALMQGTSLLATVLVSGAVAVAGLVQFGFSEVIAVLLLVEQRTRPGNE